MNTIAIGILIFLLFLTSCSVRRIWVMRSTTSSGTSSPTCVASFGSLSRSRAPGSANGSSVMISESQMDRYCRVKAVSWSFRSSPALSTRDSMVDFSEVPKRPDFS